MAVALRGLVALCALCTLADYAKAAAEFAFPVVLPPYSQKDVKRSDKWNSCLFYLEELDVVVFDPEKGVIGKAAVQATHGEAASKDTKELFTGKYKWDESYASCIGNISSANQNGDYAAQNFSFTLDLTFDKPLVAKDDSGADLFTVKGPIKLTLEFSTLPYYSWGLTKLTADSFTVNKGTGENALKEDITTGNANVTALSVEFMKIGAANQYNYACGKTRTAVFPKGKNNYDVGLQFGNLQIQHFGIAPSDNPTSAFFSNRVDDCVGTFTEGSLMGIIVSLVLISVLIFGFLMLNSVQTIDRFDDPKQKQLIINAKE